jgi:hypothetical protein
LANCTDDKLMGFVLRFLLTEYVAIPLEDQPDWLTKAESIFAPAKPKTDKPCSKQKPAMVKSPEKKAQPRRKLQRNCFSG